VVTVTVAFDSESPAAAGRLAAKFAAEFATVTTWS
jgi:hypothetical protein